MKTAKKERLESAGWRVATAGEFLRLTPEEARLVELKLARNENLDRDSSK